MALQDVAQFVWLELYANLASGPAAAAWSDLWLTMVGEHGDHPGLYSPFWRSLFLAYQSTGDCDLRPPHKFSLGAGNVRKRALIYLTIPEVTARRLDNPFKQQLKDIYQNDGGLDPADINDTKQLDKVLSDLLDALCLLEVPEVTGSLSAKMEGLQTNELRRAMVDTLSYGQGTADKLSVNQALVNSDYTTGKNIVMNYLATNSAIWQPAE